MFYLIKEGCKGSTLHGYVSMMKTCGLLVALYMFDDLFLLIFHILHSLPIKLNEACYNRVFRLNCQHVVRIKIIHCLLLSENDSLSY